MNDLFGSTLPVMRRPQKPRHVTPRERRLNAREEALQTTRNRLLFATVATTLCFSILSFRLIDVVLLSVPRGERQIAAEEGKPLYSRRDIVDRNGELIATNLATASLYVNPQEVLNAKEGAHELAKVLHELSEGELRTRMSGDGSFAWIKRNLTPSEQYAVNKLGIPGLRFLREEKRVYPQRNLAAHITGYVGLDNHGLAGMEKAFDNYLQTETGKEEPLALSIDMRVQHILHDELSNAMNEFRAIGAAGMILDANSGEILGMVSLPDFDPNAPTAAPETTRFNRITQGVYEMGSVFKTFTLAAALEHNNLKMNDGYDAHSPFRYGRTTFSDFHPENRWLTVPEIFMHSSNIGTARMALALGGKQLRASFGDFGLTSPAKLEIETAGSPLVPSPWGEISTITTSFGHGISVSPLHVARATAAVVNGGELKPITLLKEGNGAHPEGKRIIGSQTSDTMRRLMRLVVTDGTATKAASKGWLVGGKTGTADKPGVGGYLEDARMTSFVGVFPMHKPEYVVLVMLDEPHATKATWGFATAGWNAAPTASRVISRLAPLLGVTPVDEEDPEITARMAVPLPKVHKPEPVIEAKPQPQTPQQKRMELAAN